MLSTLIILGLALLTRIQAGDPSVDEILTHQLCAVCDDAETIDECDQFTLCSPLEKCYLQVYHRHGKNSYYGGCTSRCDDPHYFTHPLHKRRDILTDNQSPNDHRPTCGQCCTGDNCNVHLCKAKDAIETRQMCAICKGASSLDECTHFHLCSPNQKCFLQKFIETHSHGRSETRYYGGCTSSCYGDNLALHHSRRGDEGYFIKENQSPININEHHGYQQCGECCSGENCNIHLCGSKSSVIFCASCNGVSSVDECLGREECPGDECYLDVLEGLFGGSQRVYAGCATQSECTREFGRSRRQFDIFSTKTPLGGHGGALVRTCGTCCHDSSHCNLELCKPTTPAPTTTSTTTTASQKSTAAALTGNVLTCAACDDVPIDKCVATVQCHGECYLEVYETLRGKVVYAGCAQQNKCNSFFGKSRRQASGSNVPLDKHFGVFICGKCCSDRDSCNLDICKASSQSQTSTGTAHVQTTQKLTTTKPMTTPTTQQTTTVIPTTTANANPSGAQTKTVNPLKVSSVNPTASTNHNQGSTSQPIVSTTGHVAMSTRPPLQCETCSGQTCGIVAGSVVQCGAGSSGCMNTVEVDIMGEVAITKRCVTAHECETKWYLETSDNAQCMAFSMLQIYSTAFTCHYCCTGDKCNSGVIPPHNSLYKGR